MYRHRGFVAQKSRNPIRWVVIPLLMVIIYALWETIRALHPTSTLQTVKAPANPMVYLYRTSLTWAGDPVYCIVNGSTTSLDGVSIQNWANQSIPVYAVGPSTKHHLPAEPQRFPVTPIDMSQNESLWFVGSRESNAPYTLYATVNQKAFYLTLDAAKPGKR